MMNPFKSVQRTIENSPAIHRWVTSIRNPFKSAKRTAVAIGTHEVHKLLSPVSRALALGLTRFPGTEVLGYYRPSAARTLGSSRATRLALGLLLVTTFTLAAACQQQIARTRPAVKPPESETEIRALPKKSSPNLKLVIDGAIDQVGKTTSYDPSYQKIDYPNGDGPIETGVCSDVIVRAFRKAGIDLQKDVHEDMKSNFSDYPTRWGMKGPDTNIDHRRVPNLQTYFARKGKSLTTTSGSENFLPGDIVTWDLGGGVDHIGVVVNVWYKPTQRYLVVHNMGSAKMEDVLFAWKITGHYRYF